MSLMRPFTSLTDQFLNELQPWEEEFFSPLWSRRQARGSLAVWIPPVDVIEEENEIKVTASLPGFKPEEVNVEVDNNYVTISGQTSREEKEGGARGRNYHRREISRSSFCRQVQLPAEVQSDKAAARCENGLLVITAPKSQETKRHKVQIGR